MSEKEQLKKLEERIKELKELNEFAELCLSYSILSDLCRVKAERLLDEEVVNLEIVNDWKKKADHYKQLEKETIPKIDIDEYLESIK